MQLLHIWNHKILKKKWKAMSRWYCCGCVLPLDSYQVPTYNNVGLLLRQTVNYINLFQLEYNNHCWYNIFREVNINTISIIATLSTWDIHSSPFLPTTGWEVSKIALDQLYISQISCTGQHKYFPPWCYITYYTYLSLISQGHGHLLDKLFKLTFSGKFAMRNKVKFFCLIAVLDTTLLI